jgi:hypothetical protein
MVVKGAVVVLVMVVLIVAVKVNVMVQGIGERTTVRSPA